MNPTNLGRKIIEIASPDGSSDWADDAISQRVGKRVLELVIWELMVPTDKMLEEGAYQIPVGQGCEEGPLNTLAALACWQAMLNAAKG